MKGLREQAAPSRAATPARWRQVASYLALAAASAASIATSAPPHTPYDPEWWVVSDAAVQSFGWDDPTSDLPPEAWSAQMHIEVKAPRGRWRVDLTSMQGETLGGLCTWAEGVDGSFSTEFQLVELPMEPWGEFSGRCVGLCQPAAQRTLEFTCDQAECSGTVSLPIVAALLDTTSVTPRVCVSTAVRGPAETKGAEAPSGVSIDVKLDSFVKVVAPVISDAGTEDAGTEDAGVEDAGVEDAGVEDASATDAMAEGAADAS